MFPGISAGNTGATDPGQATFLPATGAVFPGPPEPGMIYRSGIGLSLGGVFGSVPSRIAFIPDAAGGYDRASL